MYLKSKYSTEMLFQKASTAVFKEMCLLGRPGSEEVSYEDLRAVNAT